MSIDGLRVLFLPHVPRQAILSRVLRRGRERHGWRIGIVTTTVGAGPNADLLSDPADLFGVPDVNAASFHSPDGWDPERIRATIRECERLSGLPINRIVLAGERTLGRGYGSEHYYWPGSATARHCLENNGDPARFVERMFAFALELFDRFRPDLVVGGQIAAPHAMVIGLLSRLRHIPCLVNRSSKLLSHRSFWSADRLMLNDSGADRCRQRIAACQEPSDQAMRFLADFRSRPKTVAYIQKNWDGASSLLRMHRSTAILAATNLRNLVRSRRALEEKPAFGRLFDMYRRTYLGWRQQRFMSRLDEQTLNDLKYVYIALHKEPELALNVQHPEWHSQKNVVAMLSYNLPAGYRLLVRDHRFNRGRRPTRYIRDLSRYAGVTLIDTLDPQFKYIRSAALIVTDNGTTGLEGLIFGRPVLLLGENYYSMTGLAPVVETPRQLGSAVLSAIDHAHDPAELDRRLGALVDSEFETTQPDDDVDAQMTALSALVLQHGARRPSAA